MIFLGLITNAVILALHGAFAFGMGMAYGIVSGIAGSPLPDMAARI